MKPSLQRQVVRRAGIALARRLCGSAVLLCGASFLQAGVPDRGSTAAAELSTGAWRRIESPGGSRGATTTAFVHTVDVSRSDPRLAGMMLRCNGSQIEAVFVVVEAFLPGERPRITLRANGEEAYFDAYITRAGTGLAVPAATLASKDGPWRAADELEVRISGRGTGYGGIVPMRGFRSVVTTLTVDCAQE